MGTAKGKIPFSKDISEEVVAIFDDLYEMLGPPKYRILEAAIEVFAVLPREVQYALKSNNKEDRQLYFDLIRGLNNQESSVAIADENAAARASAKSQRRDKVQTDAKRA